ncbi:hypothetical protein SON66_16050 [Pseudomonas syringae]|uniref:hypothetical protein n=1 Tax=Pseudomonas syringae TaxID=317 RepID=UPI00041B3848|nr:hypothetical protein [Pseudomonas syringae]MDY2564784.1 hypothetical protein [Pseudomonas syringae]
MDVLGIKLENCYGIQQLDASLAFEGSPKRKGSPEIPFGSAFSIYAPNGFMKTSLARTFLDFQEGRESQDLVFPARPTSRSITSDPATSITPESVFVIKPYVERYAGAGTSTLLVNPKLRSEYEEAVRNIESTQEDLLKALKEASKWPGKASPASEIKEVFQFKNPYDFFAELAGSLDGDTRFSDLSYNEIFNDKTISAFKAGTLHEQLQEYISKYQELVDKSPLLSKKFNHTGAADVSKSLHSNGFFDASHTLNISNGGEKIEINSAKDFEALVIVEKQRILGDKELSAKFEAVDKQLQKNVELKKFREYLTEHPEIMTELGDFNGFRKKLWYCYFNVVQSALSLFAGAYASAKDVIAETAQQALEEKTKWTSVVTQFNERFYVPFKLVVQNQQDVILKGESPKVVFEFEDGQGTCGVEEDKLLQVLSQGEKRALYILNVLFEIQARLESKQKTLLIIDDIADSFDYKNKYAIIEYFNEISKIPFFRLIFLTHNFDFHRTISSRLQISRGRRLFAKKKQGALSFVQEKYQKNPFTTWKGGLAQSSAFLVASIPFVRNLAEYCHGTNSPHYLKLTSLLHIKADSLTLTIGDLEASFKATLLDQAALTLPNPAGSALQLVYDEAEALAVRADDDVELESKVILSIGIRLKAEEFMIAKINDPAFVDAISSNQTFELYSRFTSAFPAASEQIMVLSQVNLMTPENIHLNSFMYEPILDMSALHLYDLYGKVKALA